MSFVQAWRVPLPVVFIATVECARVRARIFLDEHKFQFHVVGVHVTEPLPFELVVAEDDVGGLFGRAHGNACPRETFHSAEDVFLLYFLCSVGDNPAHSPLANIHHYAFADQRVRRRALLGLWVHVHPEADPAFRHVARVHIHYDKKASEFSRTWCIYRCVSCDIWKIGMWQSSCDC